MINMVLGTQGELIKLAPVALELSKRKINFEIVHTGQHGPLVEKLSHVFGLPRPRFLQYADVSTTTEALGWFFRTATRRVNLDLSHGQNLVLVQGDTLSTLLGLILSKRLGLHLAHVEAGLRSFAILDPFPEEIIRRVVDAHSDLLFAPSSRGVENLRREKVAGRVYDTRWNTVVDALRICRELELGSPPTDLPKPYVLVTIHRFETIASRRKMAKVLHLVDLVTETHPTVFVSPRSTRDRIARYGLRKYISGHSNIMSLDTFLYPTFVKMVNGAEFIVTDSGGLQQESFYLGKPCLLLRRRTESPEGLGGNVCISNLDENIVKRFALDHQAFSRKPVIDQDIHPSRYIVDVLLNEGFGA